MSSAPEHDQPSGAPDGRPGSDRRPRDRPAPHGPGVVRRTTGTVKRVALVAIGALATLFAVFNSQQVEVKWIFGDPIQTPLILALAITFVAGAAVGYLWAKLGRRSTSPSNVGKH